VADVIGDVWVVFVAGDGERAIRAKTPVEIAAQLVESGLLATEEELHMREVMAENPRPDIDLDALFAQIDADQAVLDVAEQTVDAGTDNWALIPLADAVEKRRALREKL
jgi:hypothetical protein